jgi:tRNA(Arg) A34 adenosine deaminase TadA
LNILEASHLNHHPQIESGILQVEASQLLKSFFQKLRK